MKDARKSKLLPILASSIQFIRYYGQGRITVGYGADFVAANSKWELEPQDKGWKTCSSRTNAIYYFKDMRMLWKILMYDAALPAAHIIWELDRQSQVDLFVKDAEKYGVYFK